MYIPSLKENINIIINVRAETKDIRILCTELEKEDTVTIIRYALKRMKIENFYRDTKQLGFGEYRFRKSEAALNTRAPSLSGLYSPRNSQAQTAFVQDSKDNAIN